MYWGGEYKTAHVLGWGCVHGGRVLSILRPRLQSCLQRRLERHTVCDQAQAAGSKGVVRAEPAAADARLASPAFAPPSSCPAPLFTSLRCRAIKASASPFPFPESSCRHDNAAVSSLLLALSASPLSPRNLFCHPSLTLFLRCAGQRCGVEPVADAL
eukprot:126-Chlamydomonas_euryale.AAC.2